MRIALTRALPAALDTCELTHVARLPIDMHRASVQHAAYEEALRGLGCRVLRVAPTPSLPDSVFVEDTAVVTDECAVIMRPGAPSRRGETPSVAAVLARYRPTSTIEAPGTLDGGDVLRIGRRLLVGVGGRSNADGARQLAAAVAPFGYSVEQVVTRGCLHLKTAVTSLGDGVVIANPAWVDAASFAEEVVAVDPGEPFAANVLHVAGTVLAPADAHRTIERLVRRGLRVVPVDSSELARAEAGLTCCSIVFEAPAEA